MTHVKEGRVFDPEEASLFIEEFFESDFGAQLKSEGLGTGPHLDQILEACTARYDEVNLRDFIICAKSLYMAGDLQPVHQAPVVPEPEVERDVNGRKMSPKAIAWKRWQEWCNDSRTSMKEINAKKVDPAFREFYEAQLRSELTSNQTDAVQNLNERKEADNAPSRLSAAAQQFLADYRTMSSAQLKSLLSPAVSGDAARHYQKLFDECVAFGAI